MTSDLTDFEHGNTLIKNTKDLFALERLAKKQDDLIQYSESIVSDEMQNIFVEQRKMEKMVLNNKKLNDIMNKLSKKHT